MSEQLCGPIVTVDGAALPILIKNRPVPLGAALGHAAGGAVSDERRPVTNEDIATFVAEFANGAAGTFSISRVALGHPNSLGFEVFGTKAAASFDLSANAEFCYVDDAPDTVTNGWRRVIVGPDHPYIAAAQSMPFPASATEDKSSLRTRLVRSWTRLPDWTDCLARRHSPTGCETCGLRKPSPRARPLAPP